jgi:drug/metabolite transporter (DMT)-like permease
MGAIVNDVAPLPPTMNSSAAGIGFSIATSVFWAISPMFMASAGRRIGSFNTNLLRALLSGVTLAVVVLPAYLVVRGGVAMPSGEQCAWLAVSGVAGMVFGDACFYEALVLLGPRRAVKLNTLAPVVAVGLGAIFQKEPLTGRALVGAGLVIGAVMYATFAKTEAGEAGGSEPGRMSAAGLAFGLASAVCIALGSVLGRQAFRSAGRELDAIAATVVRVNSAMVVLWGFTLLRGRVRHVLGFLKEPAVRQRLTWGTLFGPIAGMLCYVAALKASPAGLVSTVVATSPLVVIPLVAVRYRVRVGLAVVVAAVVAVAGVGMISWK